MTQAASSGPAAARPSGPQPPAEGNDEPGGVERDAERPAEQPPTGGDAGHGDLVGNEHPDPPAAQDDPEPGDHQDRDGIPGGEQQPGDQLGHRDRVTTTQRSYFAAVGALAAWVGLPAYLVPAQVEAVLPFAVPALHARLIGAMYLSGLAIMVGGLLSRRWAEVRTIPAITAIWTGGLLLVTVLHLDQFDFGRTQTQIWFAAYLAYPLIGIAILWRRRDATADVAAAASGTASGTAVRWVLTAQGAVLFVLGLALLLAPVSVAALWPWPVTPLLTQIYSAPLLAYGAGSLLLARVPTWPQRRIGVGGIALFATLALIASVIHAELFTATDPAAWIWFALLAAIAATGAVLVSNRGGHR